MELTEQAQSQSNKSRTPSSSTTKAAHTPLSEVKAGEWVWMDVIRYYGDVGAPILYQISHVAKNGRLYISGESLWGKWRYGFDPETGKAPRYSGHTMRPASPDEISAEHARLEAAEREKVAVEEKRQSDARIRDAAPELLEALISLFYLTDQGREGGLILSRYDRKPMTNGDQDIIDKAYIAAQAAIQKAKTGQ